jgi:hypothetical protein
VPISKYDSYFGGKKGSAQKALDAMIAEYGEEKGKRIFYATKNRNAKKKTPLHRATR